MDEFLKSDVFKEYQDIMWKLIFGDVGDIGYEKELVRNLETKLLLVSIRLDSAYSKEK